MTKKEFLKNVSNSDIDILQIFLNIMTEADVKYCVIGGLAVNAYAEPVVSLDLDIVVAADDIDALCNAAVNYFRIERFAHIINLSLNKSDLRIQLQTDPRYQDFIPRAKMRNVLGYDMQVAKIEDVIKGKIWAYSDKQRRMSKRQKDLADILRLVETHSDLIHELPNAMRKKFE
jgi:hypothetical protein